MVDVRGWIEDIFAHKLDLIAVTGEIHWREVQRLQVQSDLSCPDSVSDYEYCKIKIFAQEILRENFLKQVSFNQTSFFLYKYNVRHQSLLSCRCGNKRPASSASGQQVTPPAANQETDALRVLVLRLRLLGAVGCWPLPLVDKPTVFWLTKRH